MNPKLLPDLFVFLEVARLGSITQAARRLHTVQTNVSARMQKLEAALGQRLLVRTSRGIHLTPAGETLLPITRRLGLLLRELDQTFPDSEVHQPVLRIGSLETFAATHIPELIASHQAISPGNRFALHSGSSRSLMRLLQGNGLDLAFVSYPSDGESFRTELIVKEELVLFSPLNGEGKIRISDFLQSCHLPLIVQRQACSYSERFVSYLQDNNLLVPRVVEVGSIEALLGFVEQGVGITVAPRTLIKGRKRRIKTIPLKPLGPKRWVNVYLVSNQSGWNSVLKRFVDHCRNHFSGAKALAAEK